MPNPQIDSLAHQHAQSLRGNYVMAVRGKVRSRPEGMVNTKLKTGKIEVYVDEVDCTPEGYLTKAPIE